MTSITEDAAERDRRKSAALAGRWINPGRDIHVVHDFKAAREILRSAKVRQAGAGSELLDISRTDEVGIFYLDGEVHRRKRSVIAKYFTLRAIETRYRDIMERTTDRLLAGLRAEGRGSLDKIGFLLAVAVAAEVIGLDHSDLAGLARRIEDTLGSPDQKLPVKPMGHPAIRTFFEADVRPAIEARRASRGEDVISRLLDEGWSDQAILTEVIAYSIAGMLTTREFIAMTAWYLFEHPELLARFRAGERDAQFAILDEVLRLEPIVGVIVRRTVEDIDTPVCGHVPTGTTVAINIRSANTDEAATGPCPYGIDPDREAADGNGFMSFGDGAHRCPGAQLSYHEARIFLERLFALPGIRLESPPRLAWYRPTQSYELHDAVIVCDPA
jgi:cytochrome P450